MSATASKAPAASGPPAVARAYRLLAGMSQRQLAERAGVDEQTVAALERHGRVSRRSRHLIAEDGLEVR